MERPQEESLKKAWECILRQYTSKIKADSSEEGPGMALFLMKEPKTKSPFNCLYRYIEMGGPMWDKFLEFSGAQEKIKKVYDPDTMYIVSVHIPHSKDVTQTTGSIRIFLNENDAEVEF